MTKRQAPNLSICLLSVPAAERKGSHLLTHSFLRVLLPIAEEIFLITGNYPEYDLPSARVHLINVRNDPLTEHPKRSLLNRSLKYIAAQLKMAYQLVRIGSRVDVVIFFIGGSGLLLPMLVSKLRAKRTVVVTAASGAAVAGNMYRRSLRGIGGFCASGVVSMLERLNYRLCDHIIVYSPLIVREFGLARHENKIFIAHKHFVDFGTFKLEKPLGERGNQVGYVGRLSQEKGIQSFLESIPKVLEATPEATFLIGGAGQLHKQVEDYAVAFSGLVAFAGRIAHDELPGYLNHLKLLVLPSYTEGLPNIMLEAMACGTPVLATPVGGVPDLIKDGETGFIMNDNSPQCVAQNILRALSHPDLERIAGNALALVARDFTLEQAVDRYRSVLHSVLVSDRLGD